MIWIIIRVALIITIIILFFIALKWYKKEVKDYVDNEQKEGHKDVRNW
jgi:uncharacterized protein YneF (UPF0154 family)